MTFIDDPVGTYLHLVGQVPALDPEEEARCIGQVLERGENAEPARRRLVEAHLGLVVSMAEGHRSDRIHYLELLEKGNDGLLRAVDSLREHPADGFAKYARPYIESALAN